MSHRQPTPSVKDKMMASNPLTDVLSAQLRRYLYAMAFVLATIYGIWQAANGDWTQFVGGLLTAAVTLLAASNTHPES